MPSSIHQKVDFNCEPQRIYSLLTDAKQFAGFTQAPAELTPTAGETFSLFGGHIEGRNIELVPGTRVVQAWRAADWEAGVYSVVKFELQAAGSGTHLVFDQAGFPEKAKPHLESGWKEMYWEPMWKFLG